jgi:DNA processing protein
MDRVISPRDDEWPQVIDELADPPNQLFVRGQPRTVGRKSIAMVGARHPTAAGIEAARKLSRGLAEAGFGIVSGFARGIDAAAHWAALDAGGYTIAVLGCGLDIDYPSGHVRLKQAVQTRGTVLSEYSPGTPPDSWRFPRRNRIIAGLSTGVVVVEGGMKSGALVTARLALDANKSVFAVPGSFRNAVGVGPNELIRTSQAALVTEVAHIFEELAPELVWQSQPNLGPMKSTPQLEDEEFRVLQVLDDVGLTKTEIARLVGLEDGRVLFSLARLEIRGLLSKRNGGFQISTSGARARAALLSELEAGPEGHG